MVPGERRHPAVDSVCALVRVIFFLVVCILSAHVGHTRGSSRKTPAYVSLACWQGTEGAPSSPQAAASAIVAMLPENPLVDTTTVSPQGYVNIRLRPAFINQGVATLIKVCFNVAAYQPPLTFCKGTPSLVYPRADPEIWPHALCEDRQ